MVIFLLPPVPTHNITYSFFQGYFFFGVGSNLPLSRNYLEIMLRFWGFCRSSYGGMRKQKCTMPKLSGSLRLQGLWTVLSLLVSCESSSPDRGFKMLTSIGPTTVHKYIYSHAYLQPSKLPWQISPKLWSVIIISTQTSLSLLCFVYCTILADDTRVIFKFIV